MFQQIISIPNGNTLCSSPCKPNNLIVMLRLLPVLVRRLLINLDHLNYPPPSCRSQIHFWGRVYAKAYQRQNNYI